MRLTEANRKWWTLAALTFSLFMIMLDVTIVNVALPAIQHDLKVGLSKLEWTVNAYTLTYAVLLLTGGKLADFAGRRRVFLSGLTLFALSSLVCAVAPNVSLLIAARGIQGVGAAFMLPATLSIISKTFAPEERGTAIGIWAAVSGIGLAIGPLVGGIFVEGINWRWIFYINVPIGVIGFVAGRLIIPESRDPSEDKRLDVPGLAASGIALFGLTYGLVEGNTYGWGSLRIVAALSAFAVFIGAFVVLELVQKRPMMELSLFRNRTFSGANSVGLLVFLAMVGVLFFVSIYLQSVLGYSPIQAGASFLPMTLMLVVASAAGGKLSDRYGPRWPMAAGMTLLTVMLLLLSRLDTGTSFPSMIPALLLGGLGFGLTMPPMTTAVLSTVDSTKAGVASGVLNSFRQTGSALGVAIMGAIVAHSLAGHAPGGPDYGHAFVTGFQNALRVGAIFTLLGAAVSAIFVADKRPAESIGAAEPAI